MYNLCGVARAREELPALLPCPPPLPPPPRRVSEKTVAASVLQYPVAPHASMASETLRERVCHGGKHLTHDLLELREVGTTGRGWFALADLPPGTQLWKEKAFTVGRNRADLVKRVGADLKRHAAFCRPTHSSSAISYVKRAMCGATTCAVVSVASAPISLQVMLR